MTEEIYRKLARRLDAIPNGFPPTKSGVELRLLAKIFNPEEAALASVMNLSPEPAADIAARAGVEAQAASRTLKEMARKGLLRVRRGDGQLLFAIMPFVVGFYEEQLPRMDAELAALTEAYFQEVGAQIVQVAPALHRVIPVEEVIPARLEVFSHERATELLENAQSWGVRDCICRVQQRLIGKGCAHEMRNCLAFAPVAGLFVNDPATRPISKEEALHILRAAEAEGLVHTTGNYRDGVHYICNCCTCCCAILRGVAELGVPTAVAHSSFHAVVDVEVCTGCGICVERCPFGALAAAQEVCQVNYIRCVGCGVCAVACPNGALRLERRGDEEVARPPADIKEWMARRAVERGIASPLTP